MAKARFNKKTIENIDVKGKKVLLRCDLNVPIKDGKITDLNRVNASVKTVKYLAMHGAKVIVCSHLGKGEKEKSLQPVCKALSVACHMPIKFLDSPVVVDDNVRNAVNSLKDGQIVMLQNTRWRPEETKNEDSFSKELASLCDVFVADAFGTCHRGHCSNYGVTKFVDVAVAGYLIKDELDKLCNYIDNPKRPFITVLGGAKIADKLKVIDKALDRSDKVIIGGGMAYTFLEGMGYEVGKSLVDKTQIKYCMDMLEKAKKLKKEILLPVDTVAAKEIPADISDKHTKTKIFSTKKIDKNYMGLDIGPETIKIYLKALSKAKTILWNGPVGLFENQNFALGTYSIAKMMSLMDKATTIIGGGDSAAAVNAFKLGHKMTHISTGGGATLEFLKGEPMPGIECLNNK